MSSEYKKESNLNLIFNKLNINQNSHSKEKLKINHNLNLKNITEE